MEHRCETAQIVLRLTVFTWEFSQWFRRIHASEASEVDANSKAAPIRLLLLTEALRPTCRPFAEMRISPWRSPIP